MRPDSNEKIRLSLKLAPQVVVRTFQTACGLVLPARLPAERGSIPSTTICIGQPSDFVKPNRYRQRSGSFFDRSAAETKRSIDARDTPEPINETYPDKLGCDTDWMRFREQNDR